MPNLDKARNTLCAHVSICTHQSTFVNKTLAAICCKQEIINNNKQQVGMIMSVIKRLLANTLLQGWLERRIENYYSDVSPTMMIAVSQPLVELPTISTIFAT
jgi:hypothetical protein